MGGCWSRDLDVLLNLCLLVSALRLSQVTLQNVLLCNLALSSCIDVHLVVVAALHSIEPAHPITSHPSVRVTSAEGDDAYALRLKV